MVYGHPGAVMELVPLAVNHHQPLAVPTAVQEHVTTRHLSMTARNVPAVPRHLLNVHRKAIAQVIIKLYFSCQRFVLFPCTSICFIIAI